MESEYGIIDDDLKYGQLGCDVNDAKNKYQIYNKFDTTDGKNYQKNRNMWSINDNGILIQL